MGSALSPMQPSYCNDITKSFPTICFRMLPTRCLLWNLQTGIDLLNYSCLSNIRHTNSSLTAFNLYFSIIINLAGMTLFPRHEKVYFKGKVLTLEKILGADAEKPSRHLISLLEICSMLPEAALRECTERSTFICCVNMDSGQQQAVREVLVELQVRSMVVNTTRFTYWVGTDHSCE